MVPFLYTFLLPPFLLCLSTGVFLLAPFFLCLSTCTCLIVPFFLCLSLCAFLLAPFFLCLSSCTFILAHLFLHLSSHAFLLAPFYLYLSSCPLMSTLFPFLLPIHFSLEGSYFLYHIQTQIFYCKTAFLSVWRCASSIEDGHLHTYKHAILDQKIRLWLFFALCRLLPFYLGTSRIYVFSIPFFPIVPPFLFSIRLLSF